MTSSNEPITVLDEANKLVHGNRNVDYGHPLDNFATTATLINGYIEGKYKTTIRLSPEDVAVIMILVKAARLANAFKRDSIVDIAGYAETLQMVIDERDRRRKDAQKDNLSPRSN